MARAAKGNGSQPVKTSDGRWRGYITLPNGTKKWYSGKTKTEADLNRKKLIRQRDSNGFSDGKGYTVGQWIDHWLTTKASDPKDGHAPKTTQAYRNVETYYISAEFKAKPLNKVTIEAVEAEYLRLSERGLAGSVRHQAHALLSVTFNSAVKRGHMPMNPAQYVENKPTAETKPVKSLSLADLQRIETVLDGDRQKARWQLALALGLRPSESRGLEWSHIDFDNLTLTVAQQVQQIDGKNIIRRVLKTKDGARTIPLPVYLAEMLKAHRRAQLAEFDPTLMWTPDGEPHSWVFTREHPRGHPLTPDADKAKWRRILTAAGIPYVKPYTTRHTAASMLLAHGVDPATVAEILGHTDPAFTLRTYVHAVDERKREAMAALDQAHQVRSSGNLSGNLSHQSGAVSSGSQEATTQ